VRPDPSTPRSWRASSGWTPSSCTRRCTRQLHPAVAPTPTPPDPRHRAEHARVRVQRRVPHAGRERRLLHRRQDCSGLPARDGAAPSSSTRTAARQSPTGAATPPSPRRGLGPQNLALIVDGGRRARLIANDNSQWGSTLGGRRTSGARVSGHGQRGARLRGGARLTIVCWPTCWCAPVRCGPWSSTSTPTGCSTRRTTGRHRPGHRAVGRLRHHVGLHHTERHLPHDGMVGTPQRYFESWWSRDFITMSATSATSGTRSAVTPARPPPRRPPRPRRRRRPLLSR